MPEFPVNSFVTGQQTRVDIAFTPSGQFVVVWVSGGQGGGSSGTFGRRFTSLGDPMGEDFQVNSFTVGSQSDPRIAMDGSGSFMVVWESFGQDGAGSGVFGRRFDSSGARIRPEVCRELGKSH